MSNPDQVLVTIDKAMSVANTLLTLIEEAKLHGKTQINVTPLQAAFAALDAAETELDQAIEDAEQ